MPRSSGDWLIGLANVLSGSTLLSEAVHITTVFGLWIVPAGTAPPDPSELLGSKRFTELLGSLDRHFDWVIIDTPPIMAVTDGAIVAHLTSGVVFVIGSEMTNRNAAQRAVAQLTRASAKFCGAVLNRVDLKHHGYYYSQYYRREYTSYYTSIGSGK